MIGLMLSTCYLCLILMNINFLDRFSKIVQISNFTKVRPVRAGLFHADGRRDGQTDITKLIVAYRNFANAPENWHRERKVSYLEYTYISKTPHVFSKWVLLCS